MERGSMKRRWELVWWWQRVEEKVLMWLAWHLPRGVVYWAAIRLMTLGCLGSPADRTCAEALQAWGYKP